MKSHDLPDDNEGVLLARLGKGWGQRSPLDREARKKRERASARTPKERQRSASARTELINFKTTPAVRQMLRKAASDNGMTMTAVLEEGLALFVKKTGRKNA